nr:hypothetical protein [Pseudomonas veronii]
MGKDNSTPAFPSDSNEYGAVLGMSMRDYFAAKALTAFMQWELSQMPEGTADSRGAASASGRQGMINYKSRKNIAPGKIGQAVCGIPHRWTIYLSALCIDAHGDRYSKSVEIAPDGLYLSDHLEDVIEHCYKELHDSANQSQMVASGWIAIPEAMSLDEARAARIFEAVGARHQEKVAA